LGTTVIAHGNSSPILKPAEHYLYFVPLFIQFLVVFNGLFSVSLAWNARGDAFVVQGIAKPVGIISPVCKNFIGFWQAVEQNRSAFVIAGLAFGQVQGYRLTGGIAQGMKL